MDGFPVSLSTNAMCEDSTLPNTPGEWIASMRASLARALASPELAAVLTMNARAYGQKSCGALAIFDHDSCSWKTPQLSLFEGSAECSPTWPDWGMTCDGVCSALPRSVRRTYAPAGGDWRLAPTLTATDAQERAYHMVDGREVLSLVGVVRLLPTLCAANSRQGPDNRSGKRKNGRNLPTLLTSDCRPGSTTLKDHPGRPLRDRLKSIGGSMNPRWAEWFMGWPIGATRLRRSGTARFPFKPRSPGVCSEGQPDER